MHARCPVFRETLSQRSPWWNIRLRSLSSFRAYRPASDCSRGRVVSGWLMAGIACPQRLTREIGARRDDDDGSTGLRMAISEPDSLAKEMTEPAMERPSSNVPPVLSPPDSSGTATYCMQLGEQSIPLTGSWVFRALSAQAWAAGLAGGVGQACLSCPPAS